MAHTTAGAMKTPTQSSFVTENMHHPRSPTHHRDIDVEAELGIHPVRRPTDIEHDVNDLGQKKRVSSVLRSPVFKEELESVVTDLLRSGDGGGHVIAREIANMLSPLNRSQYSLGVGCVSPINDITGSDASLYNKGEKLMRCKLAALYRLVDLNGWSQSIYNHITLRVAQEQEHFLINPFGLLYHEVSASKLIKINMQGDVIDQGTTTFSLNKAGFTIHSAIHSGRPDIKCIVHVHTPDVVAVSIMKCGLLPISQEAMILGEVSYHSYQGIVVDQKEKKLLIKHLGPNNKVMFLRNHGLLVCGETVEEAYHYLYNVMLACQAQIRAMSASDHEKALNHLDKSIMKKNVDIISSGQDEMNTGVNDIKWEIGEMMFEANMRMLDNMGYRTGYVYRNAVMIQRKARVKCDVELPASTHSHTAVSPDDLEDVRLSLRHRSHSHERSRWVNSPNQYTKVKSVTEEGSAPDSGAGSVNGDVSPKSRTKWKHDSGSSHSTPIRITDANQFVPKNTDPREVAEKRKKIRGQGRWEENRPGPQSQKLEGVLPERRAPFEDGVVTASKGIIQRDFHSKTVVAGPPNPFRQDEKELIAYKEEVAKKTSGTEIETVAAAEEVSDQNTAPEIATEGDMIDGPVKNDTVDEPDEVFAQSEEIHVHEVQDSVLSSPAVKSTPAEIKVDPGKSEMPKPEKDEVPVKQSQQKEEQTPKPVVTNTEQPARKTNGKGSTDVIAPKAAAETSPTAEPVKSPNPDAKGKQKKSKNRRSLSFLKKKKDKKEKE